MDRNEQLAAIAEATNGEIYDADPRFNEWMVDAVETHETLDNFIESSKGWAERSTAMSRGEIAGMPFISWAMVQCRKGDQRRPLSVIDLGDVRFALETDLSHF